MGGAKGEKEEEPKSEKPGEKVCRVRTQQSKTPTMIRTTLARKPSKPKSQNTFNPHEDIICQNVELYSCKNTFGNDPANINGF